MSRKKAKKRAPKRPTQKRRRAVDRRAKEAEALAVPEVGELTPQAHGGALRHGGTNRGGPGPPSAEFRQACRDAFSNSGALEVLVRMISGDIREYLFTTAQGVPIYGNVRAVDRMKAIEFLAEKGWPKETGEEEKDERATYTEEEAAEVLASLFERAGRIRSIHDRGRQLEAPTPAEEPDDAANRGPRASGEDSRESAA